MILIFKIIIVWFQLSSSIVKGDLFRVYFPIPPVCRFLTPQVKDDFLSNVDRDSPQLKIAGFIEAMPDLIDNMEHTERLNRGLIKITQETVLKIRNLAYLVALTINIIILSHYEITSSSDGTNPYYSILIYRILKYLKYLKLNT